MTTTGIVERLREDAPYVADVGMPSGPWEEIANNMLAAAAALEQARDALATSNCVRPVKEAFDAGDLTVGYCVRNGHCGCDNGAVLTALSGKPAGGVCEHGLDRHECGICSTGLEIK